MASYKTEAEALAAAGVPGWTVTGRERGKETVPNQNRTTSADPATITRDNGETILTVQSPDGTEHDSITIGSVPSPGGKGDEISVVKGAANTHKSTAQTPLSEWDRLDKNGNVIKPDDKTTVATAIRDPKAPPGTPPYTLQGGGELGDPSKWTPITVDGKTVGLYDPQSKKLAASVAAGGNKPSDPTQWVAVYRNPGEKASGIVGQYDPVNSELHPVATQADGKQIVTVPGQGVYSYDKDTDKLNLLQALDKNATLQGVTFPDGSVYLLDPNVTDKSTALTKLQGTQLPQTITQDGVGGTKITLVLDPATNTYGPPPGAPGARTIDTGTSALKRIVIRDGATGAVISDTPNSNYVAPAASIPSPNTTAPFIQVQDPNDPSKLIWVENKGRVTASEALKQQASYLSGQVVSGDITVDEAKAIIDAANARMTNDINKQNADTSSATQVQGAANDILSNVRGNATTGANVLANRTQAATSGLNTILGLAQGGKLGNVPGDVGSNLVNGLTGWSAELMGGQGTLDSAARMVQAADPQSNFYDPSTQKAVGVLAQMLDKYQQVTGGPHPAHASLQAQAASAGGNGFGAPDTSSGLQQGQQTTGGIAQTLAAQQQANAQAAGVGGQPGTAQLNSLGLNDNFQGRQVAAGQTPTIPNAPPRLPGMYDPAWSQAFRSPVGSISTGPNAANGFVAPPPAAPLAPQTAGGVTINVGR